MIDFPNSPSDGQTFLAPTGVQYRWVAASGLWLATSGTTPGGDFSALIPSGSSLTTAYTTILFSVITSGNSGNWYNPANGRFTPPAGRYNLSAGYTGGGSAQLNLQVRKNGVNIVPAISYGTAGASQAGGVDININVDANGTDYFDVQASATVAGQIFSGYFTAFPLSGIQGPPGPVGPASAGDFFAAGTGTIPTTQTPVALPVLTGNSGGWYNAANGRFTPPAGRYFLYGGATASSSASGGVAIGYLRKNGTVFNQASSNYYTANAASEISVQATVDANGSDYFEFATAGNIATNVAQQMFFGAFPITGIQGVQGPPGPGNAWRILQRQVVSTAQAFVELQSIPSDINEIEVHFDLLPVTNAVDLFCAFYGANGVLDVTANHYIGVVYGQTNTASANTTVVSEGSSASGYSTAMALSYASAGNNISNTAGYGIKGHFMVPNIKGAAQKDLMGQSSYIVTGNTFWWMLTVGGSRQVVEAITGLRLFFTSGNIASGSFEVWGSP
jgi:hypothetical protein